MNIKLITAASAIVLGLAFAGPSFAQTTIAGSAVSDADLPKVQEKCDTLSTATSLSTDGTTKETGTGEDTTAPADTGATVTTGTATALNLDSITLEDCKAAGLSK